MINVLVIGGGPAGMIAALRAADLGATTALITRDGFGGMAANDGPVPVRALAHAARLIRDARQLGEYGVAVSDPVLDYPRLLARARGRRRRPRAFVLAPATRLTRRDGPRERGRRSIHRPT